MSGRTRPAARRPRGADAVRARGIATFIGLGTWQLERKAWKEALIETLDQPSFRSACGFAAARAVARPRSRRTTSSDGWDSPPRSLPGTEALVYTARSASRSDVSGPGYWVFALARLANGGLVAVNRGFVPEGRKDPSTRAARRSRRQPSTWSG